MKRIFSLILVLMAVQMMFAAPYTVTNTSDDVEEEGSLRWACNQASSNKSVEITFDIEGDGNKVIKLTNQIQIQGNVTIDASSSKDSIIIDANDMEYSDYCFYINNYNSAKLNLKGLVLKNRKTSAIYLSLFDYYENTLDVLVDSCFFYGNITVYGGNLLIKNSYLNYSVIASVSESSSLEIVDCEFVNSQSLNVYLTKEPAKFVCSRTTFSRENITEKNPITYDSETLYSTPVIDTAYVKNGKLFVNGHIVSEEIVDIEIFSAIGSYNPNSSIHNRYECTKYIGATKTNSKGVFSLELTMPEKGLMLKQHFVLSASATYAKAHTSSIAFYDVKQPYWVVNTTLDEKKGSDFIVGTMRWACNYASANDTIVFDFSGKGTKEIEGFNYSTNASVDGSTYADTIILHGLHCLNVNRIVSENVVDGNGFSIAGGKMTNCISRNNKTGVEIYIAGISVENCIIEKNSAFGIHGYNSFNKIKHTIIRNNNIGVSSNNGGQCIEECDIINNIIGINSTGHPSILDSVVSCWISGNDSVGMYGSRIIYGNNIGLDKDQKTSMPNGYGIITSDYTDIIKYNIVAGNTRCGILTSQESSLDTISENFIGTNRNLDINPILGNGEDGIRGADGDLGYLPSISNCYFMNNHGSGLNAFLEGTVSSCVFSNNSVNGAIFTDFNGLSRFKQCSFSDNKKGGLALLGQSDIIDIDSCEFSRNGGYGLSISQINLNLNNSTFDSNQKEAIVNDNARSLLSNNKFLNTVRPYPAFKTTNPYPVPEFTSCKMTKTTIVIEGKIDTAAKAKIELFYTSQGEQTAEMLVDSFYTNPDGTFSDTLDRSMFVGKSVISFNATATYGKITSPLSDLVSPSLGRVDLASTEFYVKMDGYGDGSSWENAMNLQTFIYYLPQVMNGSTFYVAEGRYVPTSKGFKINSSVSIVGGFSPDATSGAVADPVKYKTVFTGDPSGDDYVVEDQYLSDPSNDDVIFSESAWLFTAGNFDVHISGCELSGTRNAKNRVFPISCGNLYLTNCTFEKTGMINGPDKKKVVADGCIFRNLINGYTPSGLFEQDSVYVNNSIFENLQGLASTCFDRSSSIVDIRNSIFKNIKNGKSMFSSTENVYLYNNLFVGVSRANSETNFLSVKDTAVIIGNIFKDCDYENLVNTTDHTFIKHNLCEKILGTDDDINTGDFADFVVDGVYNKTTGTFVPTYSDWGGYVPTIVTKSDTLPDGRSIRFSLNETKVLTDQRGVSRLPKTCMGAYEIGCGSDTTFSVDTVQIGTKIYGQTFTKVGVHDSIFETLKSAADCDSIVMHKVIVTPDPKTLNYYVKMKKEGDGDGRDWDNAMDSVDFATYLPLAPDGATFYVAEGEYRPVYDYSLAETEYLSSRQYTVNSDVTIRGGYPSTAKGTNVESNPKKYKTIFDGLIKAGKEEANVNNLFYTSVVKDLKLNFDGVVLSNSIYAIVAYNDNKHPNKAFDVNLDNVSFENNTGYGILSYSYKGSVNIDHSVFDNNNTCVFVSSSDVIVNNSSFEKNGSSYLINIANGGDSENKECTLHIDSSSFVGNTGYIQAYNELIIKNSKFDSNETSGNLISTWSSSDFPDFKVDFINNTFVGNKIGGDILENYSNALTTVERCVFADNECGNDMLRASSMSVNNSNALRNVVKSALFNIYVKSSFISDTIENCTANDIVKYSSEGCKIDSCLIKNNDAYLLSFTPNTQIGNLKYDLLNSEVDGNTKSDMESENKVIGFLCSQRTGLENDSVNIVRTKFRNNKYKDCSFIFNYYTFLNFDQCLVDSNEVKVFMESRFSQSHIYNSTFADNNCDNVLQCTHNGTQYSRGTGATYMNNTLIRNKCRSLIDGYYSNSTYVNNTIVGNAGSEYMFEYFHNPAFVGNLVFGNTYKNLLNGISVADENISSNVMPTFTSHVAGDDYHITFLDGNIMSDQYYDDMAKDPTLTNDVKDGQVNHLEDLTSLFEGTYNSETGLFTPVLAYNGGFTPTVALKKDVLPDGTSIRFPRLENVLTDQRGIARLDSTCMGAYELGCGSDTTFSVDTVQVGTKIYGQTFTKVGVHDSIFETLKSAADCDSIVMHKVIVTPDPKTLNYYVKMKKEGDGDGRDWDNAMDSVDFATYLPLAPDGATFYVAEGTYKPKYDVNLSVPSNSSNLCYTINSDVTIRGGYPADAKGEDVPSEPDKYKTIFTGDIKGDDIVNISKKDDGRIWISEENASDNSEYLFFVQKNSKSSFDGIVISNSYHGVHAYDGSTIFNVDFDGVTFVNNYTFAVYSSTGKGSIDINRSSFKNNVGCVYSDRSDVSVKNSSFEENGGGYWIVLMQEVDSENKMCSVVIDSVDFVGNTGALQTSGELLISNSTFDSNINGGVSDLVSSWNNSYFPDYNVTMQNTKFINNKSERLVETFGGILFFDSCRFSGNVASSSLIRTNWDKDLVVKHSSFYDNQLSYCVFECNGSLTLVSDTIESSKSRFVAYQPYLKTLVDSCLIKNNESYLFGCKKIDEDVDFKFELLNSEIIGNKKPDVALIETLHAIDVIGGFVDIRRTLLKGNEYNGCGLIHVNSADKFDFVECFCDSNYCDNILSIGSSQQNIFSSTFANNEGGFMIQNVSAKDVANIVNNTIVSNKNSKIYCGIGSETAMINNTIVGNTTNSFMSCDFSGMCRGNIFFGNVSSNPTGFIHFLDVKKTFNNIMELDTTLLELDESNIISDHLYEEKVKKCTKFDYSKYKNYETDVLSLFEGTYNSETGLFTPVLAYNGGFTPTVALKKDVLADGTSIRFPRLENVLTDQRGEARLDETCMGAYEIKCSPIITELKDTVVVGDSYTFNEKNLDDVCQKVGSYYFSDTLAGAENCDSIVNLSLAVRPQKRETGFYVKVDGTGDGSDWINAMSPKDFAEYLPLVYDGETFHIAAGTYKSTYVDPELGRMYNINSSVTLIGGYPDTVTVVGVPPMPETYTTTLSADVKSGDDIEIYTNRSGDYSLYGFEDNDSILIRVNGTPTVSIYGITLSGVKSDKYGAVTMNDGGTLNLDKCAIMTNNSSGVVASNAKINVTSTLAYHNVTKNGAVFRLTDSELNVEHSSFHENVSSGESSDAKGTVANLTNSQSTFTNNTVANNWADMGAVFALSNSQVSLSNNTLVGNQSIAKEPKGSFVVASDSKSKVTLFGNMIVGNGAQPVDGAAVESEGYNIFSTDFQGMGVEKDMFMGSKDYEFVMDGTPLSGNADVFIANVNDNGGFTPTVAVIESMFDGGAVISIPSSQRKVEFDQREMVRKDTSCVGAFEFPTYVNYFVKQSPVGDGTGRDWDNAMGDTTFFRYFSIVPSGATFYVAAGTYHPLGDRLYNTDSYKNRQFFSSRPLNVFGGYHPQAQMGAVADPSKYVTLLSSDFNGDDEFTESASDYSVMSYSNYKDNSSYVMTIVSKLAGDVHLKGLTFSGNYTQSRGSSAALSVSSVSREIPVALTIDSCSFEKTYVGIYSYVDSLFVRGCRFDTIYYLGLYHLPRETVSSVLEIENSSFTDMTKTLNVYASKGKVLLQNSTFNNAITLVDVQSSSYNKTVDLSLEMYHNTFGFSPKSYQGIVVPNFVQTTAKGNIFNTNFLVPSDNSGVNAMKPVISDYNLFVEEPDTLYGAWTLGENDILVSPSDLKGVMPGTLGEKRFSAVSSLEKPENYTKVVALESDVLNEKYVRMPIEEAKVKADQIATERLDLTCLGAYEFFKGRDTVYVNSVDTVCLGMEYDRNGWELQSDTLPEGVYVYGRFMRGKIATDTIDTLTLHVNQFSKVLLDQVAVAPTLCHGDGYGEVSFTSYSTVPGSAIVYVVETTGDTLSSDAQSYNSVYNNKELPVGKFDIKIVSQTQCVEDTAVYIEVSDRDSLSPLNQIDDILTDCANEPTSELSVAMKGFHPTMKFYHNDVEITEETKNDELVYEDDAAVTSFASLNLSNIPVGKHIVTAVDACDNTYVLSEFEVSVSPSQLVEMQLVDYTKDSLACGLDNGFAEFKIVSGAVSVFTLTSDEGYNYTLRLQGKDTVLVLNDLTRGNYKALLKKVDEKCSDSSEAEFTIMSPEPLSLSLTSNGEACADGAVSVVAEGGRGSYTFHWTDPTGKKFDSTEPVLSEASAGTYTCVVEDSTHCLSHTESLSILPNVEELSELNVDKVETKDITCINGNNGTIEVKFSTDNKQQSVACEVTNDATGEVTKVAGTYKKLNGLLAIRTLAAGSYSYEVYYGSETCRLDTNSIKGNFKISAKAVPFAMKPLAISAPQTCFNPANGTIANTVTGWEDDYKAYMQTKAGAKYKITPEVENGVAKLKVDTLSAGSFYFVVEDACGGKFTTDTVTLPKYEPLSLDILSFTDSVTCARATDAEIKFTVNGGIGLNHLAFVDEKSYTDKDTVVSSDNGKGIHTVAYKSVVEGCKDSIGERIRIAGPDTLAIKFTLTGNCPGSALIPEVTGESAPYSYWWSDGENDIEGTAEFPFEMEEGRTYSLTVSDVHSCDEYTKSFTIPSASELPSVSHVVTPSSEKCYKGNNGNIKVKASISKLLDFAVSATISCVKVDDEKTSFVYQCVLDPDGAYNTPETLSPGYYRVTTRLGSFDCDMGVEPAESVVLVDTLPPLKIQPEFQLKPHTCEQANGSAKFFVDGWTHTHTAILLTLNDNIRAEIRPTFSLNYEAEFRLKLRYGKYQVIVTDKCGQSDTSEVFEILHEPTFVENVTSEAATCINEPNGVLDFDVQGWTSNHQCELINKDNKEFGYFAKVTPAEVDESVKRAHFHINTIPAGEWRIKVTNECGDNCQYENLVKVDGIDPYKIELNTVDSKLELVCPYDTDGVVALNVTGGCKDAMLYGSTTRKVSYWGPTGMYVDSFIWKTVENQTLVPIYDSLNPVIEHDTTFNVAFVDTLQSQDGKDSLVVHYDTVVNQRTVYPQMMDEEGNLMFETIVTIDSVEVKTSVEKYGWLDSLSTSPIEYDVFNADPEGFKSGKYKFINLRASTYRFTYKSTLEGCTDKYNFDTEVKKPDDVHLNYAVMPITCSTKSDGEISLAPRRGAKSYSSYFVGHDTTDAYKMNRLYKHDLIDGKDSIVEYKVDDEVQSYQIDQLYDQSDLTSVTWSFSQTKNGKFAQMSDLIFPDSTDFYEEIYYKNNVPITAPVYSNSHLEKFWKDGMGEYFEANVVSIANLKYGFYEALVVDQKACKYRDTFEVKYPAKPLQIDNVVFDEALAECDPTARQIMTYVSGGWGDYGFSFSDDAPETTGKQQQSDGYRGGEASYSDNAKLEGWGVSPFLAPGTYTVAVYDKNGCIVEAANKYTVKTTFSLSIDTVETVCAEDDSAAVAIKFLESPVSGMTYDVVEYESSCRNDVLDECREFTLNTKKQNVTPSNNVIGLNLSTQKRYIKTHGLFVYKNDEQHCGTYVEGTVVDTIPIFKASRKSIKDVTCNGLADGMIELFVNGGKAPYKVQRNSSWNSGDEIALYAGVNNSGLNTLVHEETLTIIDLNDTTKNRDTVIVTNYVQITDLPADSFYFTVIDANGCRSVMGDPANYDEKIFVKQPDSLKADFAASIVCKDPSVTTGGNVFFQNVKGGVAPYTLSYRYNGETEFETCESVVQVPVAVEGFKVDMKVTDANKCIVDSTVAFRPGELNVDQYDFWATTWYEFGDVVALIDVCGPDDILDSVAYVFRDETGAVDSRIKILDERMYIYDLESNKTAQNTLLHYADRTKEVVPDLFFKKNFRLRDGLTEDQAKHLHFFKFEDSSVVVKKAEELQDVLAKHSVLMKAYFNGCEYQVDRNGEDVIGVMKPGENDKLDKIGQRYQIISLTGSPNPFGKDETITIRATFAEKVDAKLYFYFIDGKESKHFDISSADIIEKNGELVYSREFAASSLFQSEIPDYVIVFLTTGRDQKSTTLLHSGVIDFSK